MRGTSGNYLRNGNPISILLKTTSRKIAKGRIERQKVPHPNSRCSNSQLCGVRWSYFAPSERMPALTDQKARIFGTSLDHMLTSPCCCTAKRSRRHLFANLPCLLGDVCPCNQPPIGPYFFYALPGQCQRVQYEILSREDSLPTVLASNFIHEEIIIRRGGKTT